MKKLTDNITIENIYKEVAEVTGLSEHDAEKACRSQFKFMLNCIQSKDTFDTVMLMYIGKFTLSNKCSKDGRFLTKKQVIENGIKKYTKRLGELSAS